MVKNYSLARFFFRFPQKIIVYIGVTLVLMAVPFRCLKKDKLHWKILFVSMLWAKSIRESVDIILSFLDSKDFLNVTEPSSCATFSYKPTTCIVQRIMSSGNGVD